MQCVVVLLFRPMKELTVSKAVSGVLCVKIVRNGSALKFIILVEY
jgi:hypothetical protein